MSVYRMTKAEQREFEDIKARLSPARFQPVHNYVEEREQVVADLMAFLGIIHNTPAAKRDWIEGR